MTLSFPTSILTLAAPLAAAWAYVRLARLTRRPLRIVARAAIVALLCLVPLGTRGPGPVQMVLGLLIGYLAIRLVALGHRWRGDQPPDARTTWRALVSVEDVLRPAGQSRFAAAGRTSVLARRALAVGLAACGGCVLLLVLGDEVRLWGWSRYADDLLVCLEVGVGAMGINNLIIGVAALNGRSVSGIQDRPLLSASLGELWARRWNHLVETSLARGFFRPLSRAGAPALGVLATFAASGVMHVLPVLASGRLSVTLRPAAQVLGFFFLHGGLVMLEHAAGLEPLPRGVGARALRLARLRTVVVFVLLSPLLLGPFADVTGVHGRQLARTATADRDGDGPVAATGASR